MPERHPHSQTGVTLVISSLLCGGAEKVAAGMANYWIRQGRPVTLVTLYTSDLDFYPVDNRVHRVSLGLAPPTRPWSGAWGGIVTLITLGKVLRDTPHPVVISFMTRVNILTLLTLRKTKKHLIVTEHNNPAYNKFSGIVSYLRQKLYPRADALTVLTRDVDEQWARSLMPEGRTHVIPNFVDLPDMHEQPAPGFDLPERFIVAAGRLAPQKGFDLLLDAFAVVHREHPDISLIVLGDGRDRPALEKQRGRLGLGDAVLMPGVVKDVRRVFSAAELFVLSSRFEGFGNVLVEAMHCGTPAVSFDCPSGPSDIIRDGVDGVLVPAEDTQALARSISELLHAPDTRRAMGRAAVVASERYAADEVMKAWDRLVVHVLAGSC